MSGAHSPNLDSTTHCPSCGRFAGAQEICSHCGARISKRLSWRALRYGTFLLAVLGLIALWIAARGADIPTIQVQDSRHTMNWAYVRLEGTVTRPSAYDPQTGYLQFWLDDGTGEIMAAAYGRESRSLIVTDRVPSIGDVVIAAGTLRIREDFQSLVINVPEHVIVRRPTPVQTRIGDIAAGDLCTGLACKRVRVVGQVRRVELPYEGLTVIVIRDETGEIDVTYTADEAQLFGDPIQVVPGDSVAAQGVVSAYKGELQIALAVAGGLEKLSERVEIAVQKALDEIVPLDVGRMVQVEGAVTGMRSLSAGIKCVISDGSGATVPVVLWNDVLDRMPDRTQLFEGTWLAVRGVVSEYRGELELIPELALDVAFLPSRESSDAVRFLTPTPGTAMAAAATRAPTATSTPTATRTPPPAPTASPTASLTAASTPSAASTPTASPTLSASPTATPTLTATPTVPPTLTPTPGIETISTGRLGAEQIGRWVVIQGQIVEAASFSIGVKLYVDDGSGRGAVWIPQELYSHLAPVVRLAVNDTIRAEGVVQEYQGEREVVPQAAGNIVVVAVAAPGQIAITRLGDLTAADVDRMVTVEAQVARIDPFSQGVKLLLDDGSGRMTLLLWQNVYDLIPQQDLLLVGAWVQVTGKVGEYRGELEIVPGLGNDVVVK